LGKRGTPGIQKRSNLLKREKEDAQQQSRKQPLKKQALSGNSIEDGKVILIRMLTYWKAICDEQERKMDTGSRDNDEDLNDNLKRPRQMPTSRP